jgi:hypothetical protein
MAKTCKLCKSTFEGRSDKIFCSPSCKALYHQKLKKVTNDATDDIDKILHRNRSILLEILGKVASSKKVSKMVLDQKKFNYTYVTSYHLNSQNKMVNYVYDFSWIVFSDKEVLIKRLHFTTSLS